MSAHVPGIPQNTVALTYEDATHGAEPQLLGLGAEGWVYVSLTLFFILALVLKLPKQIAGGLDSRIADTRRQLDEAKAIRAEAEALLAEAQKRNAASAGDADAIVARAREEAQQIVTAAEEDASNLVARRARMAEEKIAAAERGAVADIRAAAASAAVSAATALIAEKHDATTDKALIDRTIAGLGRAN